QAAVNPMGNAMRRMLSVMIPTLFILGSAATIAAPDPGAFNKRGEERKDPVVGSTAQMLQCNSPDPARAVIGCTTLIREAIDQGLLSTAYSNRGAAYEKRGESAFALSDFDQAIKVNPKNAEALRNRGDHFLAQNDF